ncbi:TerB family tellurite resistance protein [uncultured Adlercreutzia sp.]|uniref:TerB family tellurite resistance protein n=1 Tax=uncultured Adlercreutzia sp. TaxID=875803 RepID=UPI0025EF2371|nr:TerB family tellurite resistance protein [uncultured Adlercreutzia sp.]MCI9261774.1 hypothetical protein [Eggerthellaceae bacterium]
MAFLKGFDLDKLREGMESGVKMAQGGLDAGLKAAQEGIANFKVEDAVQGARETVEAGVSTIGGAVGSLIPKASEEEPDSSSSCREFVALLWYLANVDGVVSDQERETLNQLAGSLDDTYASYAEALEKECSAAFSSAVSEFGPQAAAKVEAQKIIESLDLAPMEAKLMCWNLLALANADGLDENELDYIRFVSERAGVPRAAFEELRNYSDAVVEIGKARESLKASGRPYSEVEPLVSEYAERERIVLDSAQALISDR